MAPPGYPCSQCGSTEFEEVDAIWYCHNGHVQEGGQQVGEDDADFGRGGKTRRLKYLKEEHKTSRVYRGQRGFELYLKAWQYILWKQCHALIYQHGLPEELWTLVRELWGLWVSKLTQRFSTVTDLPLKASSKSSDASGLSSEEDTAPPKGSTRRVSRENPSLIDTVSLNYLGIVLLRHRTSLSTLYNHIRQQKICYIRAIRSVPQEMKDHLAPEYHLALDTIKIPKEDDLQQAAHRIASLYGEYFGMALPPINWTLMSVDSIRNLGIPLEIFPVVKFLAKLTKYEFAYPGRHATLRRSSSYPEAQLMALVIVATKMCYPFNSDTVSLSVQSNKEPAAMQMNWRSWSETRTVQQRQIAEHETDLSPATAIETTEMDILAMPAEKLDQYMDWFQQTFTQQKRVDDVRQQILNTFPLSSINANHLSRGAVINSQVHLGAETMPMQSVLQTRPVAAGSGITAPPTVVPGEMYQQYRSTDELSGAALMFYQEAARLSCLSLKSMIEVCVRTEAVLFKWVREERRSRESASTGSQKIDWTVPSTVKTNVAYIKQKMPQAVDILVGLQYRDRLSVGQNRIDLGYHAFHWSIIVFDGQYHRFDVTDGIVQDPTTFEDINPNRVWMHRHLTNTTLSEIPRYLGSVRIGGCSESIDADQIASILSKFQASELGTKHRTVFNCFTWATDAVCVLRDLGHLPQLDITRLQDFALKHADERLADFKRIKDPTRYPPKWSLDVPSCIVV